MVRQTPDRSRHIPSCRISPSSVLGDLEAFAYPIDHEGRQTISVKNPLNDELSSLRTSLVPGLLRSLR